MRCLQVLLESTIAVVQLVQKNFTCVCTFTDVEGAAPRLMRERIGSVGENSLPKTGFEAGLDEEVNDDAEHYFPPSAAWPWACQ